MADGPIELIIVGGGVAGLSLLRAAALAGMEALLVERAPALGEGRPDDAGASSLPAALLNPWRGRKGAAHPDDLRGLDAVWRWHAALRSEGRCPGAARVGVLRIPTSGRQARTWREHVTPGARVTWLEEEAVPRPYRAPFGALRIDDGGAVLPRRWLAALADSAVAHGASLRTGARVARIERRSDGAWQVVDVGGERIGSALRVAVCVGADPSPAVAGARTAAAGADWVRTRGDIALLQGGPALPHPLAGGIYAVSADAEAGSAAPGADVAQASTYVGGGHRPPEREDPDAPAKLRRAIAGFVPELSAAAIVGGWSGVRAKRPDARPVVHERAAGLWTFGAFAGRGFLCAADRAERLVAGWLHAEGRSGAGVGGGPADGVTCRANDQDSGTAGDPSG